MITSKESGQHPKQGQQEPTQAHWEPPHLGFRWLHQELPAQPEHPLPHAREGCHRLQDAHG
jgi:hypothetical protein